MGAYTLNATTIKPIVNDLIDAIDRNSAALLTVAAISALGPTAMPPLTEKTVAAFVKQIASQFAKP